MQFKLYHTFNAWKSSSNLYCRRLGEGKMVGNGFNNHVHFLLMYIDQRLLRNTC